MERRTVKVTYIFTILQALRFRIDVPPEVPLGTILTYECPDKFRLSHDWYAPPSAKIECTSTGEFKKPLDWGKCIYRKEIIQRVGNVLR